MVILMRHGAPMLLQDAARQGKAKLTADVQMYAVTAEEVAQAKGLHYVDMYNAIMSVKDWDVSLMEWCQWQWWWRRVGVS